MQKQALLSSLLTAIAVSGCAYGPGYDGVIAVALDPVPGSMSVGITNPIVVQFNKEMNPESVKKTGAFLVYPTGTRTRPASGRVDYDKNARTATFTPVSPGLPYATDFTVEISKDVKAADATILGTAYAFAFTTQAAPPPPPLAPASLQLVTPGAFDSEGRAAVGLPAILPGEHVVVAPVQAVQDFYFLDFNLSFAPGLPPGDSPGPGAAPPPPACRQPRPDASLTALLAAAKAAPAERQPAMPRSAIQKLRATHLNRLGSYWDKLGSLKTKAQRPTGKLSLEARPMAPGGATSAGGASGFGKCQAPYELGKLCQFQVLDSQGHFQPVTASLQSMTAGKGGAYYFVDVNAIGDPTTAITPEEFAGLDAVLTSKLIPSDTRYFGEIPDTDGNGKLIVVFSDLLMADGGALGYVAPWDLFPDGAFGLPSNEGDIFYAVTPREAAVNGVPRDDYFARIMPSTMVHELKHLIAAGARLLNGNDVEELWIEEPSAVSAEQLAGYGSQIGTIQPYAEKALSQPERYRIVYNEAPATNDEMIGIYGYGFLFAWRVAERIGHDSFWKAWVAGPDSGIANLEAHTGRKMTDLMTDFSMTLLLDHTGRSDKYNYQAINLRDKTWARLHSNPLDGDFYVTRSTGFWGGFPSNYGDQTLDLSVLMYPTPYFWIVRMKDPPN